MRTSGTMNTGGDEMKIGLIDVDGHNFPNLAIMKISAYHKSLGDQVEWFNGFFEYDKVYMSKVFTFTDDFDTCIRAKKVVKGGTGYNLTSQLPYEIEHQYPDYDLYKSQVYVEPEIDDANFIDGYWKEENTYKDTAYGFLTRGCPRQCNFCIVSGKEGKTSLKVADLSEFWNGQKNIVLLDPNITACKDWEELFEQLIKSKAYVDFSQGVDARTLTEHKIELFMKLKLKHVHFALDNPKDTKLVIEKLTLLRDMTNWKRGKVSVYVLVNFGSTLEQDLKRIYAIKELGFNPYVMIYDKMNAPKVIKKLGRYVNNKYIFWSDRCKTFDDYLKGGF